jgi:hypothetical protein
VSRDRLFDRWVRERLSTWSPDHILEFERWLLDQEHYEFVPAVRAARKHRAAGRRRRRPAGLSITSPQVDGT